MLDYISLKYARRKDIFNSQVTQHDRNRSARVDSRATLKQIVCGLHRVHNDNMLTKRLEMHNVPWFAFYLAFTHLHDGLHTVFLCHLVVY